MRADLGAYVRELIERHSPPHAARGRGRPPKRPRANVLSLAKRVVRHKGPTDDKEVNRVQRLLHRLAYGSATRPIRRETVTEVGALLRRIEPAAWAHCQTLIAGAERESMHRAIIRTPDRVFGLAHPLDVIALCYRWDGSRREPHTFDQSRHPSWPTRDLEGIADLFNRDMAEADAAFAREPGYGEMLALFRDCQMAHLGRERPLPRWARVSLHKFRKDMERLGRDGGRIEIAVRRVLGYLCAAGRTNGLEGGWHDLSMRERRKFLESALSIERMLLRRQPPIARINPGRVKPLLGERSGGAQGRQPNP